MTKRNYTGFSLIEVMIVVVIIGILASIAYPSYTEYVKKGSRAEAKTALLESAQALERYYSLNGRYVTTGSTLPSVYQSNVPSSGAAKYTVGATGSPSATAFTLRATRAGSMTGDACGDYEISHTGERTLNDRASSKTFQDCW